MEVEIKLDRDYPVYTNNDTVSGKVIMETESPVKISTITVTLVGIAVSRLGLGGKSECHQFPELSECHRINWKGSGSPISKVRHWRKREVHLPGRLPPSVGDVETTAEVKAEIQDLHFVPLSDAAAPQQPFKKRQFANIDPSLGGIQEPFSWQIDAELLQGPRLVLGEPIPLRVKVTPLSGHNCAIWLNDFQTMVIETTYMQVRGSTKSVNRSWVVQTMANLRVSLGDRDACYGTALDLPETIWATHKLPSGLASSFEICNIKRTYQLEVRLGWRIGLSRLRIAIQEFRFPVQILATKPPEPRSLSKSILPEANQLSRKKGINPRWRHTMQGGNVLTRKYASLSWKSGRWHGSREVDSSETPLWMGY
ncbi:uncharacterized protein N7459_001658 [Penicillium hispanicum]|uniref:uncharacterized protein n=1 Tax=Penicillium hispanicum TaxID=1080232 RepID=UPI00253F92C0|nr:uncharacterized protein N7459_001658 [Penicillium hispanicum]KAJ5595450.1 hypothetical protein N7459_001658 [Penicillium hispanicum]